jgi:hypothetical protein
MSSALVMSPSITSQACLVAKHRRNVTARVLRLHRDPGNQLPLEVARLEASSLADACKHLRPYLNPVVKGKNVIRPARPL